MRTYSTKASDIDRRWFLVDADSEILGRLASEVAYVLRGKHNPLYAPHLDTGDHVVVVNAARIRTTGRKGEKKVYFRHSGYPGGDKYSTLDERMKKHPEEVIRDAVRGMLPKGPLGRQMIRKLQVYAESEHPHAAQTPIPYPLGQGGRAVPPRTEKAAGGQ